MTKFDQGEQLNVISRGTSIKGDVVFLFIEGRVILN